MKDIPSKTFVLQHDQSDCGVACLLSIIKFYKGNCNLEYLRRLSGTSKQGTTLFGLLQASKQLGFDAEGLKAASINSLIELSQPTILHVLIDNRLQHYVVYYPNNLSKNLEHPGYIRIGDPAKGIVEMSIEELNKIWQSKTMLRLTPNAFFIKRVDGGNEKKKWIIDLVKDDFVLLLNSLFLGVIISLLGISMAIFSQKLIDDILPKENEQKLWLSLALVALLLLLRSGFSYLRGFFMIRQGMDFNNRIIQSFYGTLLRLPKSFFDTRKIGELIARMNDTRRIQTVLSLISGSMIIDLLVVLVSMIFMFSYTSIIGFIMFSMLPVYFLILYWFNKPIINAQKEAMAGYAMTESNFVDTMQGVTDIKLMNKQLFFEKMNALVYSKFQNRVAALGKVNIKFSLASEVLGVIIIINVFGVASWMVLSKQLMLGEMIALLSMAGNIVPAVNRLVVSNIQIQEALIAFGRMFEFTIMEKEISPMDFKEIDLTEMSLCNVSFCFPGGKQLIKDVSFKLRKGEIIALLGDSGGGKSTLLQIIQKFYVPESGMIEVGGIDLKVIDTYAWRDQIGAVSQEIKIFNGNLLYNITLSDQSEDYEKAINFCEEKGFGKYFSELIQGYYTLLGEEGINISGGQKQLVALARALFRQPRLLLLDEVTSAMDKTTENFVISLLQNEKERMAILVVTHQIKTAQRCDGVYVLEDGIVTRVLK